jgi:hypothetical protein
VIDRATLHHYLVSAEAQAAQGHRNVERQRRLVIDLERDGRNAVQAKQLLASLERAHALHLNRLATISDQLEKLS